MLYKYFYMSLLLILLFCLSCSDDPASPSNKPPIASFTFTPTDGHTLTTFTFDASGSHDDEDASSALQVRWDCEDDGIWDTEYDTTKTMKYRYSAGGNKVIKLEIRDTGGLTDVATGQLNVTQLETGTVSDIDGNTYYTVKIGTQWWMAENLKVTHYRNGDEIPNVTDGWENLTSGAYCAYNNDNNNVDTYGLLYNWFAVADSHNIAPAGWHVPSEAEWQTLVDYLGGDAVAGGKMKATGTIEGGDGLWFGPYEGATNESGFSALPGGFRRFVYGRCYYVGSYAFFWSAAESGSNGAGYRGLGYGGSGVFRDSGVDKDGYSVRCVMD